MTATECPLLTRRMLDHPRDSNTLEKYVKTGGYAQAKKAIRMSRVRLVDAIKTSGLVGRGGAGFPTGEKWDLLGKGDPTYLIVNADESEPGSFKDRQLLERDPHQIVEGTIIAASANRAKHAFIYVRGEYAKAARRIQRAVDEAYEAGFLGQGIFGSRKDLDITVHLGAGAYICGEETALINSLEGRRGGPRLKPPAFPALQGLYMQPTIVNNVETIANLPHILELGPDEYRRLGHSDDPGTFLFSVSGHVNNPGNFEVFHGLTWRDLIFELAGGIPEGRELKAWIPGGVSAPWLVPSKHLDLEVSAFSVAEAGSMLGSSGVIVMDETTCVVKATERILRFFARGSCGKCTPCREGTTWLERIVGRIENGLGREEDLGLLREISDHISVGLSFPPKSTTICQLGPSCVSSVISILKYFPEEVEAHIVEKRCPFRKAF